MFSWVEQAVYDITAVYVTQWLRIMITRILGIFTWWYSLVIHKIHIYSVILRHYAHYWCNHYVKTWCWIIYLFLNSITFTELCYALVLKLLVYCKVLQKESSKTCGNQGNEHGTVKTVHYSHLSFLHELQWIDIFCVVSICFIVDINLIRTHSYNQYIIPIKSCYSLLIKLSD